MNLYTARHTADYDTSAVFDRENVQAEIDAAERAFLRWNGLRDEPNTNMFLAALLVQSRWGRANLGWRLTPVAHPTRRCNTDR